MQRYYDKGKIYEALFQFNTGSLVLGRGPTE